MLSPKELLALADMDPELQELIRDAPPLEIYDPNIDIRLLRLKRAAVTASQPIANPGVDYLEEDRKIPMRDGMSITVRTHQPRVTPSDGCPGLVMFHGGGFCLGNLENETEFCRRWADLGGVAVNVDYRLAPEFSFPTPVYDAYDALKWTALNAANLQINCAKGFIVGGISAGANLAAVSSHLYCDEMPGPPLTGVYLSIPTLLDPPSVAAKYKDVYLSREQNKNALILNDSSMALFDRNYKPDSLSPLRSPFLFSHQKLPPTYFQVCGLDPLRDEALIYEEVLREDCGIKTKVHLYKGLPHGFWYFWPKAEFSKRLRADSVEGLRWLLGQTK